MNINNAQLTGICCVSRRYMTCLERVPAIDPPTQQKNEPRTFLRKWMKTTTVNWRKMSFLMGVYRTRSFRKCWPLKGSPERCTDICVGVGGPAGSAGCLSGAPSFTLCAQRSEMLVYRGEAAAARSFCRVRWSPASREFGTSPWDLTSTSVGKWGGECLCALPALPALPRTPFLPSLLSPTFCLTTIYF